VCLLVVLSRIDPAMPLVIAANRDERLDRPAVPATVLRPSQPRVIGGRDLLAGGTWLAVNEHGVVAGLTNQPLPNGRDETKRSRGELPLVLAEHADATSAVEHFVEHVHAEDYNAAWLIVGDRDALYYVEVGESGAPSVESLASGVHVLANGPLSESSPKTDLVRERLARVLDVQRPPDTATLRTVLSDHSIPEGIATKEVDPKRPPALAAACVHTPEFGTRSAAIVRVPADGPPHMEVADGPSCEARFVSVDEFWSAPIPAAAPQRR
jgi:uncharacterized protein with NRDE domain